MIAMTHSREELMDRLLTLYREGLSCRVVARALVVGYHPPLVSAPTTFFT